MKRKEARVPLQETSFLTNARQIHSLWRGLGMACVLVLSFLGLVAGMASGVRAQTPPGGTQAPAPQSQSLQNQTPFDALLATPPALRDYRQELRDFVQSVSVYARALKPGFTVIAQNGVDLLGKADPENDANFFPARTYMHSLDGVIAEQLFTTYKGDPPSPETTKSAVEHLSMARKYGLKVLSLEYADTWSKARGAIRKNVKNGFLPYIGSSPVLSKLSPWKPDANPRSILSMRDVKNFAYLRDSQGFGTADEYANALHNTNYDLVVVDVFHGRTALTPQQIALMKYKKLGSRRLVFAHLDITAAESYRYYWKPQWKEGAPKFIKAPYTTNPDKYHVDYADPAWQAIISGNAKSYIYGIITQGFDGVVLDGLDAYQYFEGGL
ncbi:endo alpha-1,4 polygalactosaminidase [Varunaivibrio sulfuroxidans]|uniref:Cysteinyl-tRNA synthetase n=1 Tax=Varunaivibrio sulfuroxidans TaxID=1773489 RepID=A0A4R3J792_9PROT|nr:endo alpha-1,4 polygalactosaminidase [Varunaivibrio sulfuroxidans]TCS61272.1 cysteinyl-tRNA synthetase [Varunaivibrio sulfuroxidans]WES31109.1 endo alpha-1,4 polygalactosaminidase [Varunaivibrio sulfuroxidans]